MFEAGGTGTGIQLTPGKAGTFKITVDGDVWWDKKAQDNRSPDVNDMKILKSKLTSYIETLEPVAVQ